MIAVCIGIGSLETGERKTSSDRILDIYFMKRKVPGMSS